MVTVKCSLAPQWLRLLSVLRESWLLCLICLPDVSDYCEAIPLGAMGLSAVRDCVIPNLTHLLLFGVIHANSDGFGESAHVLGLV